MCSLKVCMTNMQLILQLEEAFGVNKLKEEKELAVNVRPAVTT